MRIFYSIIHNGRSLDERRQLPQAALSYAFDYDGFINNILSGSVARDPGSASQQHVGRTVGCQRLLPTTWTRPPNTWPW